MNPVLIAVSDVQSFWVTVPPPVVGGIIGAVVGLIGVFVGQRIIHSRERRKDALDLFLRTMEDVRLFRDSQVAWFYLTNQAVQYLGEEPPHFHAARQGVANAKAKVLSVRFGIELMFGDKGQRLSEALTNLVTPDYTAAMVAVLDQRITEIELEIRPLWKLVNPDPQPPVGGCCGENCGGA